jgi:hypothetical protein
VDSTLVSGLTERLDIDDPILVTLRTHREPSELDSGALALPMTHRAELTGVVFLGARPFIEGYRPDEREILAWAVQQVVDVHRSAVHTAFANG